MKRFAIALAMGLLLTACAAKPQNIPAKEISSARYSQLSCGALLTMRAEKQSEIDDLSGAQNRKRIIDGVSNVLIVPGAASLFNDSSEPLGRAKGELNAMVREYDRRCLDSVPAPTDLGSNDTEATDAEPADGQ